MFLTFIERHSAAVATLTVAGISVAGSMWGARNTTHGFEGQKNAIERRFDRVDDRLDKIDDKIDEKIGEVSNRIDKIEDKIDEKIGGVSRKIKKIKETQHSMKLLLERGRDGEQKTGKDSEQKTGKDSEKKMGKDVLVLKIQNHRIAVLIYNTHSDLLPTTDSGF